MTKSKLIDKAVDGLQIRQQGDVYQVIRAPYRASSQPLYTTRNLQHARNWRANACLGSDGKLAPERTY